MIRFSAALVAVAIGVLIGGVAASKLVLVYIAIVLSAVALVALAIGVLLNREELFGEKSQGAAPVGAGASPVPSARSGESQEKIPPGARVAPPPPFSGAAGSYAGAFGVPSAATQSTAASSSSAADLSAARPALAVQGQSVQGRSSDPVPPWETKRETPAREPWSPSGPDWIPAGLRERAGRGAGARAQSAWQGTAPDGTPGDRGSDWGATGAATRPAPAMPRSWAPPPSSPPSADPALADSVRANPVSGGDAPAVKPGAGSGSAAPSWFDRLGNPAIAKPVATSTPAPQDTVTLGSTVSDAVPGRTVSGDEDDDWPARYSWLDTETDGTVEADATNAERESGHPAPAGPATGTASGAGSADLAPAESDAPGDFRESPGDGDTGDNDPPQPVVPTVAAPVIVTHAASEPASTAKAADAEVAGFADHSDSDGPGRSGDSDSGPEVSDSKTSVASQSEAAGETGSEPPADAAPATALVTVVPGVPRYHEPDCVLIRFMPEGDLRKLTIPQAKEEGCTPCAACQPEG